MSNSDVLNEEMRRKTSGSSSQSLIIGLNRFGRGKNQTEPNRTEINRFEPVFGSVRFKKLKKKLIWLFILVQNRTEPEMLSPSS
jgi:hypothetical protein